MLSQTNSYDGADVMIYACLAGVCTVACVTAML
jgi:hypothetical protein